MAADLPPNTAPEAPAAAAAPAPAAAEPIYVDAGGYRYSVIGNTLLPREKIEAAIRSASSPKEAIDAVNRVYVDAGYPFVVIGGQVNNKLVALQVVQGRIAEIDAPPHLLPFYRRLLDREDVTQNMMLRDSALAEFYAARQGVRAKASFSPAKVEGGTKLTVVEEPIEGARPVSGGLSFSNLSGRFSSRYTAGGNVAVRPGGGLELTANYVQGIPGLTSDSAGSSYKSGALGASLVTPWGLYALSYSDTEYQIGEAGRPAFPYGRTEFGGITGTQLVYADSRSRIALTEGFNRYSNRQGVFPEEPVPFIIVDQDYNVANIGATYTTSFVLAGQNSTFSAGVTVAKGLSPRTGSFLPADPGVPNPRFALLQANLSLSASLPAGFSAGATINAQVSDDTLPQAQQWILGGFGNLSAWLPATLIGDTGALGRATLSTPPMQWGAFSFSGSAFAEAGISRPDQRPAGDPYTRGLADLGLSVVGSTTTGTSLTLAYAWPVWYRNVEGAIRESVDRSRAHLYFTLNQTF